MALSIFESSNYSYRIGSKGAKSIRGTSTYTNLGNGRAIEPSSWSKGGNLGNGRAIELSSRYKGDDRIFDNYASNPIPQWKHEIYLSFRGGDTGEGFTHSLYRALRQEGIKVFIDDELLVRGQSLSDDLLKAIEESSLAIIVLSQNYAASTWCLDELEKIIESKNVLGQTVLPIFYGVNRSDVKHQRGKFGEVFRKLEERFRNQYEKVERWRDALREAASLSGWVITDRHEAKLIEEIVTTVWRELQSKSPQYWKIKKLYSLLRLGLRDVHFIGIWGMGGIGKTTIAKSIYERICGQFELSCFLADVRDRSEKYGLVHLQRKLLSHFKSTSMEIEDSFEGKNTIRHVLRRKRVLIILDDVSERNQLECLAGKHDWFGPESRIIITTRDKWLLKAHGTSDIFELGPLNDDESLQLFCQNAFGSNQPPLEYLDITKHVVQYAKGLPLALKVLGANLSYISVDEQNDALNRMKNVVTREISETLMISYNALDETEKVMFLDIACFFNGLAKDYVTEILRYYGLDPLIAINVLLEKSLIAYDGSCLRMHDLIQQMGRNIVLQEYPQKPRHRSRLWSMEDIDRVLRNKKGTGAIQSIVLKLPKPCEVHWDPDAFLKMHNLKLLIFSNLNLPRGLNSLPRSLRVLEWKGYPLKTLPLGSRLDYLGDLKLHHSKITQLWEGVVFLPQLKSVDLSHSEDLIQTPDFNGVPKLERLILEGCTKLVAVHPSLGQHKKLAVVNLKDCRNLESLPRLLNVKSLDISGCSKIIAAIDKIPQNKIFGRIRHLDLSNCHMRRLPEAIGGLFALEILKLFSCCSLIELPNTLLDLTVLHHLDIRNTQLRQLPSGIGRLTKLQTVTDFIVGIDGSKVSEMAMLSNIETLAITELQNLDEAKDALDAELKWKSRLVDLSLHWSLLEESSQSDSPLVLEYLQPPNDLLRLEIWGYPGTRFPDWVGDNSYASLEFLAICDCRYCSVLPPFGKLPSLKRLFIAGLDNVTYIGLEFCGNTNQPFISLEILLIEDMPNWREWIHLQGEGIEFPCLRELRLLRCPNLMQELPKHLPSLEILQISECNELEASLPKMPDNWELLLQDWKETGVVEGTLPSSSLLGAATAEQTHQIAYQIDELYHDHGSHAQKTEGYRSSEPMIYIADVSQKDHPQSMSLDPIMPLEEKNSGHQVTGTGVGSDHHDDQTEMASSSHRDTNDSRFSFKSLTVSDESQLKELPTGLHSFRIVGCPSLESLPEELIKDNPDLLELHIIDCHSLKYIGDGTYPALLKTLYFDQCRKLQFLPPPHKVRNFAFLENLCIGSSCVDSLVSFPLNLFPKLKTLCLWDCPNLESFSMVEGFHDDNLPLESLEIRDCPKLISFPTKGLPAPNLVSFTISNCEILKSLPNHMTTALKSLQSLFLLRCPELESLPQGGLPSSLNVLSIDCCNKLSTLPNEGLPSSTFLYVNESPMLAQQLLAKSGEEWNKIARIPHIEVDGNVI